MAADLYGPKEYTGKLAAIDFLSTQDNVDPEKIGIIGICGWNARYENRVAYNNQRT